MARWASGYVTRAGQKLDVIYAVGDGSAMVVAPDGDGRYWYDSVAEAQAQHGDDLPVVHAHVEDD